MVLGAGGAGRALAFGAAEKGAHVIIANRYHQCCDTTLHALTLLVAYALCLPVMYMLMSSARCPPLLPCPKAA